MPYINPLDRKIFDDQIGELLNELDNVCDENLPGTLNYIISKIVWQLCGHNDHGRRRYERMNAIVGALESAKLEFYRRIAVPYEDEKTKDNGDI